MSKNILYLDLITLFLSDASVWNHRFCWSRTVTVCPCLAVCPCGRMKQLLLSGRLWFKAHTRAHTHSRNLLSTARLIFPSVNSTVILPSLNSCISTSLEETGFRWRENEKLGGKVEFVGGWCDACLMGGDWMWHKGHAEDGGPLKCDCRPTRSWHLSFAPLVNFHYLEALTRVLRHYLQ